ncbi:MAG: LicD family protein [Lachnospiraceae bacterium]|nr:LicD family protein [Lachnospiraceae bacterium]
MDDLSLKKLQETELEILVQIDDFCKKNNIKYSLYSGTLLGAVRHSGFIPWDDDVDIIMTRSEFTRFCMKWSNNPISGYYFEYFEWDNQTQNCHAKIRKDNTVLLSDIEDENYGHHGIWVDIFVMDKVSRDPNQRVKMKKLGRNMILLVKGNGRLPGEKITKRIVRSAIRMIPNRKKLLKNIINQLKENNKKEINSFDWCDMCTIEYLNIYYPPETSEKYTRLVFCNREFPVFANYDAILRILYGDYMKLPPIEERVCTHSPKKIVFDE